MNALSQSINREQRKIGRKLESINHEIHGQCEQRLFDAIFGNPTNAKVKELCEKRNTLIGLYDDLEEIEDRTIHPEDNVSIAKGINDIQKVIKAVGAI